MVFLPTMRRLPARRLRLCMHFGPHLGPHLRRPHRALFSLALLAAMGTQAQTANDSPAVLSLPAAVLAATEQAPSPAAASAMARAARERAVAVAQRPDPVLRLSLDNLPVQGADRFSTTRDFMTQRSVSVMQTFTRADKRSARAESLEREAQAALAERSVRLAAVQQHTAIAWFERRAAEQRRQLLHSQRAEAQRQVEAGEAALRGARATPAELITLRDGLAQLAQAQLDADAEVNNTRRALARWTGGPHLGPLGEPPSLARHRLAQHSAEDRLARHPELVRLAAGVSQAEAEAVVARADREPDWTGELMFSQRGSRYANMVSIGISLPLPWDRPQRQDRELAARLAQAEALRAEREDRAREYAVQTEAWNEAWRAGLARLALIDRDRTPLAQQRIEAALAAWRGGQGSLTAVLDARRAALALQMERIDVELQTARPWARLEYLTAHEDTTAAPLSPLQGAPR